MLKAIISFLSILLYSEIANAYPNFIGHGYTSCINCHYNPFGGGPVTDYGRAVSATTISARHWYSDKTTDEKLANTSGLFFNIPKYNWLRAQLNYRGFQLVRNPGSADEVAQWINMQADARLIFKLGENNRFIGVANFGYAPPNRSSKDPDDTWRTREHYLGYRVNQNIGIYAGLMDKLFGLRVVEHVAYSRSIPQVTQNDQTHGVMAHINYEAWEGGLHYYVGNMLQDEELRMKGFSLQAERTIFDLHRVGFSFLNQNNAFADNMSMSVHGKFNLKEGSAILAEFGQSTFKGIKSSYEMTSQYALIQTYLRPARGFYIFNNIEYMKKDTNLDPYTFRWGPGIQYFPAQRLEFRFDLYNTRNFSKDSSSKDSWMYLFQTHVWL